jgi:predicted permease
VSAIRRTWARFTSLFHRDELDREFDDEAQAHVAFATDDYMRRGLPRDEAERLARRKFGLAGAAKDAHRDARGCPWLEGLLFDARQALRSLYRDRLFAVTAVTTLVIAITLNVTVFTVRDAMLFRGLPVATDSDRLVYLAMRKPSDLPCCPGPVPYTLLEAWRAEAHALQGIAMWRSGEPITLRDGNGRPLDMTLSRWSANTLRVLGLRPAVGRDFGAADETPGAPQVAVISHSFWGKRFGSRADVVGTTIHINGAPATIIGVLPERFALLYEQDLWMPLAPTATLDGNVVARLREGATIQEAQIQIDTITSRLQAADPEHLGGVPLVRTYAQAHVAADAPTLYGTLWIGAWFVLLIACTNLTNLMLVRTTGRWREWSTRIALGAGQLRLMRQALLETMALAAVAAPLAWWLTKWLIQRWDEATRSRYLALDYSATAGTLAYLLAITLLAASLIALAPMIRVLQAGVNGPLKGEARGVTQSVRGKRVSAALVSAQMGLAIVLLLGAGVLVRSFANIVGADTGVRDPGRITAGLVGMPSDKYATAEARAEFAGQLVRRLRMVAGIEAASVASAVPTRSRSRRVDVDGIPTLVEDAQLEQVVTVGPRLLPYVRALDHLRERLQHG